MSERKSSGVRRRSSRRAQGAEGWVTTWEEFEPRLAEALGRMADNTFLILSTRPYADDASYFVEFGQVVQGGRRAFVAEAVGNAYLSGPSALSVRQEAHLKELGWQEPWRGPIDYKNYRREWLLDTPLDDVARLAVRTLREVYGIEEPADLVYRLFAGDGRDFAEPLLGIEAARRPAGRGKKARPKERPLDKLTQLVGNSIREFLEVDEVATDNGGTFHFAVGTAVMVVSVVEGDPPMVRVSSPVLVNVGGGPDLLEAINEFNAGIRFARVVWYDGHVTVGMDLPAIGITGEGIAFACGVVRSVADNLHEGVFEAVQHEPD